MAAAGGGLTMASNRQIAANRRNAGRSTGPRTSAGKKRAARNADRHGLGATLISGAEHEKRVERLARKIAGNARHPLILECARAAAEAELQLARVRRAKVILTERIMVFGALKAPKSYTARQRWRPKTPASDEMALIEEPPRQRCRIRNLSAWPRRYEERYRNSSSLIATSAGLRSDGSGPYASSRGTQAAPTSPLILIGASAAFLARSPESVFG